MRNPPSTPVPQQLSQADQAEDGLGKSRALEADQEPKVAAVRSGLDSGASGALRYALSSYPRMWCQHDKR